MRKRLRIRLVLLALVALVAAGIAIAFHEGGVLRSLELDSIDARFAVAGEEEAPDDIVVVGIDARTLQELDRQFPFPRDYHARVIDRLRKDGAKVIAFDIAFDTPGREAKKPCPFAGLRLAPGDCALLEASERAGNLVYSVVDVGKGPVVPFFGFEARPRDLKAFGARAGYTGIDDDPGGVRRRYVSGFGGVQSFAAAVVERAGGEPPESSDFREDDSAYVAFHGGPGTIPEIPYWRVHEGEFEPGTFDGKLVVVGATDPTLKDVFPTATSGDSLMTGPEFQAHAISTARRANPLREASNGVDLLLIVLLGVAAPAAAAAWRLRGLALALLVGLVFVVAAQLLFNGDTIVAFVHPLLALVIGTVGALAVQYFTETRERRRTRALFARFVPENVVDQVLERTDDDLRIGGVQREGTVMFSDLRGFTSFAERLPVERVIDVLNQYLGTMSEAILDNGGTLVAYMGDGIMAVFGAPIEQPDHADRGLAAAIEMRDVRLPAFNDWLRSEGLTETGFRMGIGLNSGPVMSGNVGSERRLEYTAIGDTTNTSSRIESMTKDTPHQLLLAESTQQMLQGEQRGAFFVGEFDVRGREQHIRLWSVPEPGEEPAGAAAGAAEQQAGSLGIGGLNRG
jgi:adenylate cyclase